MNLDEQSFAIKGTIPLLCKSSMGQGAKLSQTILVSWGLDSFIKVNKTE